MQNKLTFILEGLSFGVVSVVIIVLGIKFFATGGIVDHSVVKGQFAQYVASARLFQQRNGDYQGVCGDIVLTKGIQCVGSADAFKIETQIDSTTYYCADSTGFAGTQSIGTGTQISCR